MTPASGWMHLETTVRALDLGGEERYLVIAHDITGRKHMVEALGQSEAKYRDLYDNAPDMFASVEPESGKIIECNQTLRVALGYEKDEILHRHISELYDPDCEEDRQRVFNQFVETGEVRDAKLVLQRKDSSRIPVSLNVSAVRDEEGGIMYSRSVWRDLTEEQRAEEAAKKSDARFRHLVEIMNDGLNIIDGDGIITYVNDRSCEIFGYSQEEMIGRPTTRFLDEENQKTFMAHLYQLGKGVANPHELTVTRKDGTRVSTIISPEILTDASGDYAGGFAVITDISDRVKAEQAMGAKYTTLFRSSRDGIAYSDISGHFLDGNQGLQDMLGYTIEELTNLRHEQIFPGNGYEKEWDPMESQPTARGYADEYQTEQERKDGTSFPAEIKTWLANDEKGEPVGKWWIVKDITSRKHNELLIQEQQIEIEKKNIALSEVIERISLDKRQLEERISMNVDRLLLPIIDKLKGQSPKVSRAYVELLEKSLRDLTSEFGMKLSRKEVGLTPREVEVCNLVKDGRTGKEISKLLKLSFGTIEAHRHNIRKKLGISAKKVNLTSYLRAL